MMGTMMMGGGWWLLSWLIGIVILGLFVWGIVLLVKGIASSGGGGHDGEELALEILKKRYARGEINREEYEQKRKDLMS
ncbi:MAG: SHOCT domain-containing protein [Chloroflexi bacterium]|nr:SHOCT domain-containing protein [Chloroflexota bacterium]